MITESLEPKASASNPVKFLYFHIIFLPIGARIIEYGLRFGNSLSHFILFLLHIVNQDHNRIFVIIVIYFYAFEHYFTKIIYKNILSLYVYSTIFEQLF